MDNHVNRIAIVGLGNPMIDISATVDKDFLLKYDLSANSAKHIESENLFAEMESGKFDIKYTAGGSIDNACRIAKRLLGTSREVGYIGCIGEDKNGKFLQNAMDSAGVITRYEKISQHPTGRCVVLITEKSNRSLTTHPGAANKISVNHLMDPETWRLVEQSKVIYSGGFFLAANYSALSKVAQFCAKERNKVFCFNLSAEFLCRQPNFEKMKELLEYADIVIGNIEEAEAFAEYGLELPQSSVRNHEMVAKIISALPKKGLYRNSRYVILTRGQDPCICSDGYRGGQVKEFSTIPINKEDMVDTNGAGDAFVGGLLAYLASKTSDDNSVTDDAIQFGLKVAYQILKVRGCDETKLKLNLYKRH